MTIVITGAGGFVGQTLAKKLIETSAEEHLILADIQQPPNPTSSSNVKYIAADLTDPASCQSLIDNQPDVVYILHGIMSSLYHLDIMINQLPNILQVAPRPISTSV